MYFLSVFNLHLCRFACMEYLFQVNIKMYKKIIQLSKVNFWLIFGKILKNLPIHAFPPPPPPPPSDVGAKSLCLPVSEFCLEFFLFSDTLFFSFLPFLIASLLLVGQQKLSDEKHHSTPPPYTTGLPQCWDNSSQILSKIHLQIFLPEIKFQCLFKKYTLYVIQALQDMFV